MQNGAGYFHILYGTLRNVGGYIVRMKFSMSTSPIVVAALYTVTSFVIPAGRRQSLSLKLCLVCNAPRWVNSLSLGLLYRVLHYALTNQ